MVKRLITAFILVFSINSQVWGTTHYIPVEVNLEAAFKHEFEIRQNVIALVNDKVTIDLPTFTCFPGNTYSFIFTFYDGVSSQEIKIVNAAYITFNMELRTGDVGTIDTDNPIAYSGEGSSIKLLSSHNVLNTVKSKELQFLNYTNGTIATNTFNFNYTQSDGEISDGSTIKSFEVEFTVPNGGFPGAVLFDNNHLEIVSAMNSTEPPLIEHDIPLFEPAACCPIMLFSDANRDCKVDLADFAIMASEWLMCGHADPGDCLNQVIQSGGK